MEFLNRVIAKVQKSGADKPIDITRSIRQAMDRGAVPMSRDRTVAPNHFQIFVTPQTQEAFTAWGQDALVQEFARDAAGYAAEQNYSLVGSVVIELIVSPDVRKTEVKAQTLAGAKPVASADAANFLAAASTPGVVTESAGGTPARAAAESGGVAAASSEGISNPAWLPFDSQAAAAPNSANQSVEPNQDELMAQNKTKPLLEVIGGQTYLLVGDRTVVGRGKNVDISLQDTSVSHQHFEIVRIGNHYVMRDLGSTNGTFVENNRVNEATLLDRNVIMAGRVKMIFWRQAADPQE